MHPPTKQASARVPRGPRAFGLLLLAALAGTSQSGCATVEFDYPKSASHALADTGDTDLGRLAASVDEAEPGEAGFYLLSDGIEALAARLIIAHRAERSLDVQYYLINDDVTGFLLIRELMQAADRGVRVRLLLDDIQTQGYERGMWAMDAHPNIEVRIFNPFATRKWRYLWGAGDLMRVNRRMHNKSFTGDNQVTVIGGRNIGAEYFGAREDVNFGDLDVLCFGAVAPEVSSMFDLYWNDRLALPVPALVDEPKDPEGERVAFRDRLDEALADVESSPYGAALRETVLEATTNDESEDGEFIWVPYQLVYDVPGKAATKRPKDQESILTPLGATLDAAEQEFVLVSPYFVPRRSGIEELRELRERGIEIKVITNSLAANNHALVHSGYAPSRKPLLEMGVEIWEVRPDIHISGSERGGNESSRATLHTKAFVVDRRRIFIGSFNFDPRSAYINTEMGIILDAPELAEEVVLALEAAQTERGYQVVLNEEGWLRWVGWNDGERFEVSKEPNTSFWTRFKVCLMGILPVKGQL